jgi:hypothetical protein
MLTINSEGVAISRVPLPLLPETAARLRRAFPGSQDEEWVLQLAHEHGWAEANRKYLEWHHERGRQEMAALMNALGLRNTPSPRIAAELVALGYEVFMLPEGFQGSIERLTDDLIRISVSVCPVFERLEQSHWQGVTACSSWHHRQGWYDAMGVDATDSQLGEEKWGDSACVCEVAFASPVPPRS